MHYIEGYNFSKKEKVLDRIICIWIPGQIHGNNTNAMLMNPNEDKTAGHCCHCLGDRVESMRKLLAIPRSKPRSWYVCFSAKIGIVYKSMGPSSSQLRAHCASLLLESHSLFQPLLPLPSGLLIFRQVKVVQCCHAFFSQGVCTSNFRDIHY